MNESRTIKESTPATNSSSHTSHKIIPAEVPQPSTEPTALLNALAWRYAVKRFDATRRISDSHWQAIETSMIVTPSSFGLQPWKFIVINNPAIKEQLPAFSWGQQQPKDCSHFVVLAGLRSMNTEYVDHFLQRVASERSLPIESLAGYRKVVLGFLENQKEHIPEWATRQVYIALGQLMTSAALLGIDACPMEGIEPKKYDALLQLDGTNYATRVACAFGYRHPEDTYAANVKVRFDSSQIIEHR